MCHNIFRNSMIIEDIKKCVLEGRVPIVLTERVIVYDYLDNMKVLEKMYNRRLKGYKIAGYEIIE